MTLLRKTVRREATDTSYRGRKLIIAIHPGDVVEIREKGRRIGAQAPLDWLYLVMAKRNADARIAAKRAARKARRFA